MQINKRDKFKVIVKHSSKKNEIIEFDKESNIYKISVAAPADKNKANKELVKFLSKTLGKQVRIKSGLKSKEKIIEVIMP